MKKANLDVDEPLDKEELEIYNIITGKVHYSPEPFREEHLRPDLVISIKVPND